MSYSPDYVSDIGERPSIDGGIVGGGILPTDESGRGGTLFVKVVDCVYSQRTTQVGWVNGNPYYGDFHVHVRDDGKVVKMVGPTHISSPHATIYNTKEESLGQPPVITYTPSSSTTTPSPTASPTETTTTTTETTNAPTVTPDSSTPSINTTTPQQTTPAPEQPQQQTPPSTPPSSPPPSGGGGSGGSGGYGGGY